MDTEASTDQRLCTVVNGVSGTGRGVASPETILLRSPVYILLCMMGVSVVSFPLCPHPFISGLVTIVHTIDSGYCGAFFLRLNILFETILRGFKQDEL